MNSAGTLRCRLALAALFLAGPIAAALPAHPAEPDPITAAMAADESERAGIFRRYLQDRAEVEMHAGLPLMRATIGFAAAACSGGDAFRMTDGDSAMIAALAEGLAQDAASEPTAAIVHVEALVGIAQCQGVEGDTPAAARSLRRARDLALDMAPGDVRSAAIARVADAAGLSGALPPQEIAALADEVHTPQLEAVVLRAWAIDTLIWNGSGEGAIAAVGAYRPLDAVAEQLAQGAEAAVAEGRLLDGLLLAAAIEVSLRDARTAALETVFHAAAAQGDHAVARMAARAVSHASDRGDLLEILVERALETDLPADAEYAARLMPPSRGALNSWLDIATAYRDANYPEPQAAAIQAALAIAQALASADGGDALMRVAGRAAQLDSIDLARTLLSDTSSAEGRPRAVADLVKRLAETDRIEEALSWAAQIADPAIDPEVRSRAFGALAKALAEDGQLEPALAILERHPDLAGRYLDAALRAVAVELARNGRIEESGDALARIVDPEERSRAELQIGRVEGEAAFLELVARRLDRAWEEADPARRSAVLTELAAALAEAGQVQALVDLRETMAGFTPPQANDGVAHSLAIALAEAGRLEEATAAMMLVGDGVLLDRTRSRVALAMARHGSLEDAVAFARSMSDAERRLTTFRTIAEIQAHRLDVHDLVPEVYAERSGPGQPAVEQSPVGQVAAPDRLPATVAERGGIAVFELDSDPDSRWPDLTGLRARMPSVALVPADVRARVVSASSDVSIYRQPMSVNPYNEKFIEIVPIVDYAQRQGEPTPHLIYIATGVATLSQLREALLAVGRGDYLEVENGIYTARRPIVIGPDATLVVTGADARELRLSTDDYAYLVSGGTLIVADTTITSWDRAAGRSSDIELGDSEFLFRPFITAWSGSRTFATRSIFRGLGYNNRKSWGVTVSAGPQDFTSEGQSVMESPEMQLVENLFDRLYYGFYSYHTNDTDIVGNEYRHSVIYGPDPHDYSDGILMALNTAYGTMKKHGLIVSREVSGLFVGNVAFDNKGAGIMLDRLSNHSIIYANTTFDNGHDGIAVYETACAIVASNLSYDNAHSGLRVRNSVDIAVLDNDFSDNRLEGVVTYTDPLVEHYWRNLTLDPFWTIATVAFAGNRITGNEGAFRFENVLAATLARNTLMGNGNRMIAGDFQPAMSVLTRGYQLDRDRVMLADLCLQPVERYADCRFREQGVFDFDGQQSWQLAEQPLDCGGTFVTTNAGLRQESRL
ncbi:MAG: NosD domain-containing protein [Alphaproteobacteria bacterium]